MLKTILSICEFFVVCCLAAFVLWGPNSEVKNTTNAEASNETRAINSVNDEGVLDKTHMLNSICPTRQHIQECREWCKRVDCRE